MSGCCLHCGKPVNRARAKYCSYRCAGLARQNYKVCVICGNKFTCSPSTGLQTCSPACSTELRRRQAVQCGHTERLRAEQARFVSNTPPEEYPTARGWVIQSPDGQIFVCTNLIQFFRDHSDLIDGTPQQAARGIVTVKSSLTGGRKRNKTTHWKGWTLLSWDDRGLPQRGSKKKAPDQ